MNVHLNLLLLLISFLFISCESEKPRQSADSEGRTLNYTGQLSFLAADGNEITTVQIAVADDEASRSAGLMDVRNLPEQHGMLFIFDDEQPRSFWMANTPLSLDIIFVNSEMEIIRIHRSTQPYSEKNFASDFPAKYVVEVNAGFTTKNDITEGAKIEFEL